jgi:putative ABC transport system substrate-binding protein
VRRRSFIAGFCATAALPRVVNAQSAAKKTIGFLGATSAELAKPWIAAFEQRLQELGWVNGRNLAIEYRWAEASVDRYNAISAEFASRNVDVIVTWASAPVLAAKRATTTIPIVFAAQMDPVGAGVVASLGHPGGNITGISIQQTDTAGKRVGLLREMVPGLARLVVMANAHAPGAMLEMQEVVTAARALGLEASPLEVKDAAEIASGVAALRGRAEALYIATDPLIFGNRISINTLALEAHLATIYGGREYVDAGALMSYGPYWADLFRHAADQVDKILRGAKPADIPVEQPTRFYLIINRRTAAALGLTIPPSLLATADEVIE